MSNRKSKVVSINYVKRDFTTVGLIFCLYILLVLYVPSVITSYLRTVPELNAFLNNQYYYVGLIYLLFVVGTLVPTLALFASAKVKFQDVWRKCNIKFKDLLVLSVVFIALGTAAIFCTMVLSSYLPLGEEIVSPVGITFETNYLFNPLYIFLYVIVSPLLEEFAFRGVLLRAMGRYGNRFALWAIALFYALSHVSFSEMLPSFVMSLFLTKVTLRYHSIQPAIIIHIIFNAVIYGMSIIPIQYYVVVAIILFVLYFLAIVFVFTKMYRYVRISRHNHAQAIWKAFLTRPSIIAALILIIGHSILMIII